MYSQEKSCGLQKVSLALGGGSRKGMTCQEELGEPLPCPGRMAEGSSD